MPITAGDGVGRIRSSPRRSSVFSDRITRCPVIFQDGGVCARIEQGINELVKLAQSTEPLKKEGNRGTRGDGRWKQAKGRRERRLTDLSLAWGAGEHLDSTAGLPDTTVDA